EAPMGKTMTIHVLSMALSPIVLLSLTACHGSDGATTEGTGGVPGSAQSAGGTSVTGATGTTNATSAASTAQSASATSGAGGASGPSGSGGTSGAGGSLGPPNVSVDMSTQFQTIDGFGFFGAQDDWWGKASDLWSDAWGTLAIKDL